MSFWDMLTCHTKVAGKPVDVELSLSEGDRTEPPKSAWSAELSKSFQGALFITTCARKLETDSVVKSTACWLFHKFFSCVRFEDYDEYVVAMTSIFLSGKIEERPLKIRDVINVAYRTLYPAEPLLQIDQTYTKLVDTLVEFELFLCRMLKFQLVSDSPHKYLLHYLKSLTDWLHPQYTDVPYQKMAWSLLNDCYLTPLCITAKPDQLALAACYIAVEAFEIRVCLEEHAEKVWWEVFIDDIRLSDIHLLACEMLQNYENENFTN